jgi:hypothetical protein
MGVLSVADIVPDRLESTKPLSVRGYLLICPARARIVNPQVDPLNNLYLAPSLESSTDLDKCLFLDHPRLFDKLRRKKVPLTIGGKYGGICYPCVVRGLIGETEIEAFPAALTELQYVKVTVPTGDGKTTKKITLSL